MREKVKGLIAEIEKQRLYKGKGGEIMRGGVCHLINSLSQAKLDFSQEQLFQFFDTLKENLKHPNQEIQEHATEAFRSFCASFLSDQGELSN